VSIHSECCIEAHMYKPQSLLLLLLLLRMLHTPVTVISMTVISRVCVLWSCSAVRVQALACDLT
jgi:hypothetical protein